MKVLEKVSKMGDENHGSCSVHDEEWVFYKDRKEWSDVEPVPQDDGPYPVVAIAYTDKCKLAKGYLFEWNVIYTYMYLIIIN